MRTALLTLIALAATSPLAAQVKRPDPVSWTMTVEPSPVGAGGHALAKLSATIESGWHLYSPTTPPGPIPTTFALEEHPAVSAWTLYQPAPNKRFDPNFSTDLLTFDDEVVFLLALDVPAGAPAGAAELSAKVRYQACNDQVCLRPVTKTATASLAVASGGSTGAVAIPVGYTEVPRETPPTETPGAGAAPAAAAVAASQTVKDEGWGRFLLLAFGFGLAAVFTPCVFPMIPITMSFFLNSGGKPFQQAVGFCLGIIVLFTGLGFATTAILGPFGIVQLGSNVWVNGFIGLVFAAFGLSLLGAFEITMPSGLLTKLNSASQGGGFAGTLLMGLTFALTSFACVGPFMGTLLAASVQGDKLQPAVGMATFAAGLASPFFFLALFPNYLKKMPRSGGWLARVKIVIGFIVLALALKYLSNVDAVMQWSLLTRERYLALWVILFALPGLYVLGLMRMEGIKPEEPVGVTRALVGAIFLAFSVSLVPGMFGMQLGELEAYVPASHGSPFGGGGSESKLAWMKDDYQGALAKARAENKVVLVNFTGYACTNCKWMKANMFTKPEIASALSRFVLVDLYTDGSDPASLANQQLQETRFQTVAIPHYALVRPDESIVASFTGQTRNVQEYLDFLNKGLAPQGAPAPKTTE
ncbi:MAG: cytochrome c biogenesis protein CcdA [Vicinamibacterales bacterium]